MMDYQSDAPKQNETQKAYAKRLEAEGQREIYIRKALREHYELAIEEIIQVCSELPEARNRELQDLRSRFPTLSENRFAWKISKSLTISKEVALVWSQTILTAEGSA
jgi:hypothetical protein